MEFSKDMIEQVLENTDIVDYASKYLDLEDRGDEFWCVCPFHANDKNPSLSFNREKGVFNCLGCGESGNIINFVQSYHKLNFSQAMRHLISANDLDLEEREFSESFLLLKKRKAFNDKKTTEEHDILPNNVMNKYTKSPIKEWISEGISQEVLDRFNVRYDSNGNRIVFPIYDNLGNIIAIKGRTLEEDFKILGIEKYKYYQKIKSLDFLFGLYQNEKEIKDKKEVIVVEGAKSVMLAESYGYKNLVSLETNKITDAQKKLLLQLHCDVTIALDNGVKITTYKKSPDKKYIYTNIGILPKLCNVYVVEDKFGLLDNKDSPLDKGKAVWDRLYNERIKIF